MCMIICGFLLFSVFYYLFFDFCLAKFGLFLLLLFFGNDLRCVVLAGNGLFGVSLVVFMPIVLMGMRVCGVQLFLYPVIQFVLIFLAKFVFLFLLFCNDHKDNSFERVHLPPSLSYCSMMFFLLQRACPLSNTILALVPSSSTLSPASLPVPISLLLILPHALSYIIAPFPYLLSLFQYTLTFPIAPVLLT